MGNRIERINKKKGMSFKLFLCVLPGLILVFLFHYFPIWGWLFAFFQFKPGKSVFDCTFVGLQNFKMLFMNKVMVSNLLRVLKNTFGLQLLNYAFSPLPMIFAIFLSELPSKRFKKAVQTFTTLPHFIGWVIVYSLATALLAPNGVVNTLAIQFGWLDAPVNYLASGGHVWIKQALLMQWKSIGWSSIIYFAAIAGIDQQLYEAAMVDGATKWQRIWHITIPNLIPTYFTLLIISIGNFLNTGFEQYMIFCNPLNKDAIEVLDLYVYNLGIGSGQISFSVAVGIMKSIVAFVLFFSANAFSKKIRNESVF